MSATVRELPVSKMHGTHNDFIVVDEDASRGLSYADLARRLCDREKSLGADGLLVVGRPPAGIDAFATMRIFNSDGSEAEMCGNGMRCVARYLVERGAPNAFTVATLAGPIGVEVLSRAPEYRVRVDVGTPDVEIGGAERSLESAGVIWKYRAVSLGNPHVVIFVDDVAAVDVERVGAALATHRDFPQGTNVHFVQALDPHRVRARHYERGVGVTQSCGTGSVAAAAAAIVAGLAESPVTVEVLGGTLVVGWRLAASATLTGPVEKVFERTVEA
jgi:diaminopimelate epimerase